MIEQSVYDAGNNLKNKTTYSYNDKRDCTEINNFSADGLLEKKSSYRYRYDTKDNWIEKVDYINDKPVKINDPVCAG